MIASAASNRPMATAAEAMVLPFGTRVVKRDAPTGPPADGSAADEASAARQAAAASTPIASDSPAPQAASDLDAFAKEEGVDFRPGSIRARQGRDYKLVRPRIDLGFMADATAIYQRGIQVTMQIETDHAGRPRNVQVTQSSGSEIIDDAIRLAMYDSWFGPPLGDRFTFSVRFLN